MHIKVKVKFSRYRSGVAQRVGRGIALLFHDCGTRRGWVVSSTPRPHFTPGKDPVPILQEAGWTPWPVWTGGKTHHQRDSIQDRPACSQSLYRLSYPAHMDAHKVYFNYRRVARNVFRDSLRIYCLYYRYIKYSAAWAPVIDTARKWFRIVVI